MLPCVSRNAPTSRTGKLPHPCGNAPTANKLSTFCPHGGLVGGSNAYWSRSYCTAMLPWLAACVLEFWACELTLFGSLIICLPQEMFRNAPTY